MTSIQVQPWSYQSVEADRLLRVFWCSCSRCGWLDDPYGWHRFGGGDLRMWLRVMLHDRIVERIVYDKRCCHAGVRILW
jgi:hypothetical protein